MEGRHSTFGSEIGSSSGIPSRALVQYENRWYDGEEWEERKAITARRGLESGRLVDLSFFSEERNFSVKMMVDRLNLNGLLTFEKHERKIYSKEVRQFYTYLHEIGQEQYRTIVNGCDFTFDATQLEAALEIGSAGIVGEFDNKRAKKVLHLSSKRMKSSYLNVDMHIMHYIMTFNILPVSGHRDVITEDHLEMLYHLHEGICPGIGNWILRYMLNSITHRQRNLPYGMVLTRLFRYFNVPLEGCHWDYVTVSPINAFSLSLMGIVCNGPREWKYMGRQQQTGRHLNDDSDEEVRDDARLDDVYSMSVQMEDLSMQFHNLKDGNSSWHRHIHSQFEASQVSRELEFTSVRNDISGLREEVQGIQDQQHRINAYLEEYLGEMKNK